MVVDVIPGHVKAGSSPMVDLRPPNLVIGLVVHQQRSNRPSLMSTSSSLSEYENDVQDEQSKASADLSDHIENMVEESLSAVWWYALRAR